MKIIIDGKERNTPFFSKKNNGKAGLFYTAFIGTRVIQFGTFPGYHNEFSLNIYSCQQGSNCKSGFFEEADEIMSDEFTEAYQEMIKKLPRIFGINKLIIEE